MPLFPAFISGLPLLWSFSSFLLSFWCYIPYNLLFGFIIFVYSPITFSFNVFSILKPSFVIFFSFPIAFSRFGLHILLVFFSISPFSCFYHISKTHPGLYNTILNQISFTLKNLYSLLTLWFLCLLPLQSLPRTELRYWYNKRRVCLFIVPFPHPPPFQDCLYHYFPLYLKQKFSFSPFFFFILANYENYGILHSIFP